MAIKDYVRCVQGMFAKYPLLLAPLRVLTSRNLFPRYVWKRMPVDFCFQLSLQDGDRFAYRSHACDSIGRVLYWKGALHFERETSSIFVELAKSASCILDIGANTGFYGLLGCAVNPKCVAYCFEPSPNTFEAMRTNIKLNGFNDRCIAVMAAVSDREGTTKFHLPNSGFPSSASLHVDGFRGYSGVLIDVRLITIDGYLRDEMPVDLIKIDTEGFEDAVLRGMSRILHEHRPDMFIECLPDGPNYEIEGILRKYNYRFFHLMDRGPVERISIEPDAKEQYRNYLCTARQSTVSKINHVVQVGKAA